MRIGIVTDIHDETALLSRALAALRTESVDAIVSIGDTTDLHGRSFAADEVATLLRGAGVLCVWGNHDHGLCRDVGEAARSRVSAATLEYMARSLPRLTLADCHFSHVEPWLNPEVLEDLWCFDGVPDDPDRLRKSFAAIPHRVAFIGHFHRWLAATEAGRVGWDGSGPLTLDPGSRYLVVVGPLFRGAFAVYDTERSTLEPRQLPLDADRP